MTFARENHANKGITISHWRLHGMHGMTISGASVKRGTEWNGKTRNRENAEFYVDKHTVAMEPMSWVCVQVYVVNPGLF